MTRRLLVVSTIVSLALSLGACSSSSSKLSCGEGTVQQGDQCVATAPDGGTDAAGDDAAGDATADRHEPLSFAGVTAVAPVSTTELLATWSPATDSGDPNDALRYRVFVGPADQPLSYAAPALVTVQGAVSAVIEGLQPGTKYVVGVRALDELGFDDGNTVQLTGMPATDSAAPTFGGVQSAAGGGSGAVQLTWNAAKDDLTPTAALTYLVFMSDTPGGEDFTSPVLVSPPGATSVSVPRLANAKKPRYFVVRARDAAGNVDTNTVELSANPGADTVPPLFAGCSAASNVQALTIAVAWSAATDDVSDPQNITYDIYASTTPGKYDFTQPFAVVKGQTEAVLTNLKPTTRYYFVCRARDEAGNEDGNTVEVGATTGLNPTPPTFAGITSLTGDPVARTATITWDAASSPTTPTAQMLYDVYDALTTGGEDYNRPALATSAAGATSITVSGLPSNATVFFVVRARDIDGNHDSNTVEKSMMTNVSFSLDVQTIFTHDCGVVGCHVPGNPTGGLILAPGFAYSQIVGVTAAEVSSIQIDGGAAMQYVTPGDPADSYLNAKINVALLNALKASYPTLAGRMGTQMPAPSTGSTLSQDELDAIANWIAQGASNN